MSELKLTLNLMHFEKLALEKLAAEEDCTVERYVEHTIGLNVQWEAASLADQARRERRERENEARWEKENQ